MDRTRRQSLQTRFTHHLLVDLRLNDATLQFRQECPRLLKHEADLVCRQADYAPLQSTDLEGLDFTPRCCGLQSDRPLPRFFPLPSSMYFDPYVRQRAQTLTLMRDKLSCRLAK
jgi:hypothetical protein